MTTLYKQKILGNSKKVTSGDPENYPNWKSAKKTNSQDGPTLPESNTK